MSKCNDCNHERGNGFCELQCPCVTELYEKYKPKKKVINAQRAEGKEKMKTYDDYIAEKAEEYNIGCTPKAISHNEDFVADYNCEHCDLTGCVHWSKYNN